MEPKQPQARQGPRKTFRKHIASRILAGILTLIPFAATYLILRFIFGVVDSLLAPISGPLETAGIPGAMVFLLSTLLVVSILYFTGVIVTNSLGRRALSLVEALFLKLPLLKTIYGALRSTVRTLSMSQRQSFSSVALVEFPRRGAWCLGFVTGVSADSRGDQYVRLFIPTTPNPTSGYFEVLKKNQVHETGLSVEEGIQAVISGGLLFPDLMDFPDSAVNTICRPIDDPDEEEDPYDHVWE